MDKSVASLDTLKVVGKSESFAPPRLAGFERRREHNNGGVFITPEQLDHTASTSIVDLLRRVPGIRVMDASFGKLVVASSRGGRLDAIGRPVVCRIRVMVDGHVMPITERPNERNRMSAGGVGDMGPPDLEVPLPVTSPKLVHGIEIYAGPASMPRDLIPTGEDAFCGLIAIWTK
jgi:TonB-dependent receptor-like protein